MSPKRLAVAAILLSAIALATVEGTLLHTDDGCVVETHCNTCLLQLATTGVVPLAFALPEGTPMFERLTPQMAPRHEPPDPRRPSSRGPPLG